MRNALLALALVVVALFSSFALAQEEAPYFSDVKWHVGIGNPHDAQVVFTVSEKAEPDKIFTYSAVGIATLTQSCVRPDGGLLWTQTPPVTQAYVTRYSASYPPGTTHSAMIKGTNGPIRSNFLPCFFPNVLRLDSVNWLGVTLYDLTEPDKLDLPQYAAVRE